jgi:catechol 2,3-dioxygenase-like lactoylglutathione lyase family enzyme
MSDAISMTTPTSLRPFIPALDFDASRRFYEGLGFSVVFTDGRVAVMQSGPVGFILQNFYDASLAENLMLQLTVDDADTWWSAHQPEHLAQAFALRDPKPPAMQPWGRKVGYITDPAGVLWHIAEA